MASLGAIVLSGCPPMVFLPESTAANVAVTDSTWNHVLPNTPTCV